MALKRVQYHTVRGRMQPGDIIAFSGKGNFSEIIKWATRSMVSHVGVVYQSKVYYDEKAQPGHVVDVMESTTLHTNPETGKSITGVQRNRLSHRIKYYPGEMWWLPLSKACRQKLDLRRFTDFLMCQDQKPYDMPQAIRSALDRTDSIPILGRATFNQEDFASFFCSELATAALEAGGVIEAINSSEVTPADLCKFSLYGESYYQISGKAAKKLAGHNTTDPEGFGQN